MRRSSGLQPIRWNAGTGDKPGHLVIGGKQVKGTRTRRLILGHGSREESPGAVAGAIVHPVARCPWLHGGDHARVPVPRVHGQEAVPGREHKAAARTRNDCADRLPGVPFGVRSIAGQAVHPVRRDVRPIQRADLGVPAGALTERGAGDRKLGDVADHSRHASQPAGCPPPVPGPVPGSTATQSISTSIPGSGKATPTVVRAGSGRGNVPR